MKRLPLILTILLVLLVSGAIVIYNHFMNKSSVSVWDIIPSQALIVYEVGECSTCIQEIGSSALWSIVDRMVVTKHRNDSLHEFLSYIVEAKSNSLLSLHVVQKDNFDFVFYLPKKRAEVFMSRSGAWKERSVQREFSGIQISETKMDGVVLSWTILNDVYVGSLTPVLIEDVIRTYKADRMDSFGSYFSEALGLPQIKNDAGNIYLNLSSIQDFLSLFVEKGRAVKSTGKSSLLDIKAGERSVTLSGFSIAGNEGRESLLSYFSNQSPVPFGLKKYISNRSLMVTNYGVSDGMNLFQKLDLFHKKDVQDSILSLAKIDWNTLYSSLTNEIAICFFESRGESLSRILLFETNDPSVWLQAFDRLSKATERGDTLYVEQYSSYEIRSVDVKKLPEKLFAPLVRGFDQMYYTKIENIILIADHLVEMRRFLDDIDREDVWGKSVFFNQFLESTLLESNVSVYINTPKALSAISKRLSPRWGKIYASNSRQINGTLGLSAVQFSNLNQSFYTNISFSYNTSPQGTAQPQSAANRIQSAIEQAIVTKPFVVRNHTSKSEDVFVQDSLNVGHYFSPDGKRQWKRDLGSRITGNVYQVDYLNNNKLQLFFATEGTLHVIDRLGNYVSSFPLKISQRDVEFVSVVDYDNSKKYRFLLAEKSGRLWLLDKEGKNLDGWRPRTVEGQLFAPANHHRIRGRDFILAIRKDGWAHLFTRRGENVRGFPLNLDIRPEGAYFLELGNSLATSYFIVVSRDGTKVKFNAEGKIISREPLLKSSVNDRFSLVTEKSSKAYLVMRQSPRELTLLDEDGKVVLTNTSIGPNRVDIQFYDFGAGRSYTLVVDTTQDLCYAYDSQGDLITPVPFEASGASLKMEGDKVFIVLVNEGRLVLQPLM